jgi:hypothetical protein
MDFSRTVDAARGAIPINAGGGKVFQQLFAWSAGDEEAAARNVFGQ